MAFNDRISFSETIHTKVFTQRAISGLKSLKKKQFFVVWWKTADLGLLRKLVLTTHSSMPLAQILAAD